ncbi:MAG TPA: DUF4129 domain-containing protein [Gaiellaceae bacterium]|nr:DUF4129 domain-containing protein [Gaiellaceae bacterium]
MLQRRIVPLAIVVSVLLAVVALAAHGRPLGSGGGGRGGLPGSFWDYTYTTIVILVVPLLIAGVLAAMYVRPARKKRRPLWQSLLRALVFYCLLVAVEVLVLRHLNLRRLHTTQTTPPGAGLAGNARGQHGHHGSGHRNLQFQWDELAIVLTLLLVLAVAVVVAMKRSPRAQRKPNEIAPEVLAAALDQSLDDLRNDPDLRRAIIAAYARMETALAAAGIPRDPAEAPLEYLERALLSLDTSAEAVRRLTDLFEWARFSHHEPEPPMRDEAVDALIAVRDELRASELIPA